MLLPFLAFLVASIIGGGLNGIFVRFVSLEFGPFTGTFLRFLGATLILLPFWLHAKESIKWSEIVKFLPFSANVILFSIAILHTSVTISTILYALVPLWVAFLAYYLLREKLVREHIVGLLISLIGMTILIKGSIETVDIRTFGEPFGNALIIVGVIVWGLWLIGARSLSKKYSSLTILFFTFLISTIATLLVLPFEQTVDFSKVTYKGIGSLLGVILLSSIVLYFVYQWLIKHTSAFVGSFVQYGGIVFGALAGVVVFHERFTLELALGAFLVILGVFLATTYTQLKKRA